MQMHKACTVLILDDEPLLRASLVDLFIDIGCKARAFGTAGEALSSLKATPYDLAVVDMRLPDMDGEAFIHHAYAIQPSLRFVVHTGSLECQGIRDLGPDGPRIEAVLHKPLMEMQPLIDIINNLPGKA